MTSRNEDVVQRLRPVQMRVFEPGQRVTPEVLREIQDLSHAQDVLGMWAMIGQPGICTGMGEDCRVTVGDASTAPMTVRVGTGAGWDRQGRLCVLEEPIWISMANVVHESEVTVFLELFGHEEWSAATTTPEGTKWRKWVGGVRTVRQVTTGIEIARIRLGAETQEIQVVPVTAQGPEQPMHSVDVRFAPKVRGLNQSYFDFGAIEKFRESLREFRAAAAKVEVALGPLQHWSVLHQVLLALQAECAISRPEPARLRFFVEELRAATLDVLEEIRRTRARDCDWPTVLSSVQGWTDQDWFKMESGFPVLDPERAAVSLRTVSRWIVESLLHATYEKERWVLIGDHVTQLKHQMTEFHSKQVFGGELFHQVLALDAEGLRSRLSANVQFETQKTFSAPYSEGGVFQGTGRFYSEGTLSLTVDASSLQRAGDLIVLIQTYKRRTRQYLALRWNGQSFVEDTMPADDHVNTVMNIGGLVPRSNVTAGQNTLHIDILKTDLDCGITGLWIYEGTQ